MKRSFNLYLFVLGILIVFIVFWLFYNYYKNGITPVDLFSYNSSSDLVIPDYWPGGIFIYPKGQVISYSNTNCVYSLSLKTKHSIDEISGWYKKNFNGKKWNVVGFSDRTVKGSPTYIGYMAVYETSNSNSELIIHFHRVDSQLELRYSYYPDTNCYPAAEF